MGNNIGVYILNIKDIARLDESYCIKRFPLRYERAQRFKFEADKLRSLAAGWLIAEVLSAEERDISVSENGKPHIAGKPEFNISHSGDYTVLAVSDFPVGIDIEKPDIKHLAVAERVFTKNEIEWMKENPEKRFFTLWTLKEAASKAIGKGLLIDYRSFDSLPLLSGASIELNGVTLLGNTNFIDEYAISVVCCGKIENINYEYVKPL